MHHFIYFGATNLFITMRLNKAAFILSAALIMLGTSCKKDKLHFDKIIHLESHTNDRLNAITVNGSHVYAVGGDRFLKTTILESHDGGSNWQAKDFTGVAGKSMYGITTGPTGKVYTIGFSGMVLWTENNGDFWHFEQLQQWEAFKDIEFVDANTAIGIIGISYNSGGIVRIDANTHKTVKYDSTATEYNDIQMVNSSIGYIAGYGVILKTTNGGADWHLQDIKNDNFTALHAISADDVWTCGVNGSIFHTTDGGGNWERKRNGNSLTIPRYYLHDIVFTDAQHGWCVGEKGVVIYTDDGGEHWMEYEKFTSETLRSIALLPDGNLLVCGDNGALYKLMR